MLPSQIAMTPAGSYRDGLESHLGETYDHARWVQRRLDELGRGTREGAIQQSSAWRLASTAARWLC